MCVKEEIGLIKETLEGSEWPYNMELEQLVEEKKQN